MSFVVCTSGSGGRLVVVVGSRGHPFREKKSRESDDDEEKQVAEDLKPKKIARNAKEERIARGKEMRGKGDYPTMDDVLSDWDSTRDGKKEEAKVNEDIETRTNLDDVDEERLSKSAMDQTKKPESKMQEADEKIREVNENQASKENIKGELLSEKNTQADDEKRGNEKEDGSSREGKIKSQKRSLEKRERKAVEKQTGLTNDPEVSITQQSIIINGSYRSVKTQQETTAEPKSSPADDTVLQKSKLRSEGRPYADSGLIAECMTQRTTGSAREEADAKGGQTRRVKTELLCAIRKQTANYASTAAHEDGLVKAVEKAQEGSANECSRSRKDISDGSARDNKEEENREDEETPKMIAAESGTSEKVFSGRSSEGSKKHLQTASASDGSRRTCDIVDRRNQEIKADISRRNMLSKDDSTQVADGDRVA
ncbi:unnamed protein product [Toxocara canis]|uniref:CALD1 n=1 Tax=Toxocara canis TaxID=6265 RepID=A0A183ULZ6_TOXCA|nr:unnamed protein product [Toxocara canis]